LSISNFEKRQFLLDIEHSVKHFGFFLYSSCTDPVVIL
jgi:hypothetical protein